MSRRLFNDETEARIASLYIDGNSLGSLARKYRTNATTIKNAMGRHGVYPRAGNARADLSVDHAAFDGASPAISYWIGFLLADGCILAREGRAAAVALALSSRDAAHVDLFAAFCGLAQPGSTSAKVRRVSFTSSRIVRALAGYGIVARKTGREVPPDAMLDDRDFWRGMVDGDGWISVKNTLGLCGSEAVCLAFAEFASRHCDTAVSAAKIPGKNCWSVTYRGRPALRLMAMLYGGAEVALARKAATANVILYDRMAKAERCARGVRYADLAQAGEVAQYG